jgi:hypothetical protein
MAGQKSVRRASSRTHIKQELTVAIAIANFVRFASRNLRPTIRCVPVVAANERGVVWQRGLSGKVK